MRANRVPTAAALFTTGLAIASLAIGSYSTAAGWLAFGLATALVAVCYVFIPESWEK